MIPPAVLAAGAAMRLAAYVTHSARWMVLRLSQSGESGRKRAKTDGEKRPRSRLASPCKELLLLHIKHTYRYGAVWFPVVDLRGRFEYCFKRDARQPW
jgi:hypothetical protein